jgi:hypothetical protein
VSFPEVTVCNSSAPNAACSGDGQQVLLNPAEANSTDWVLSAPAAGGALVFSPVYALNGLQVIACQDSVSGQCAGGTLGFVPPSSLVFGLAAPYSPPFDISQLNTTLSQEAFAAGFLLVAMGFVIGKPISMLVNFIKG